MFLVVRALNAYQMDEQPGTDILTLSERATLELRSLLVPPTESKETVPQIKVVSATGSVRTPSKKIAASKSSRSVSTSIRPSQSATNATSGKNCRPSIRLLAADYFCSGNQERSVEWDANGTF